MCFHHVLCLLLTKDLYLTCSTLKFWRRKWQPTPAFLLGKSHGWRSLVGCSPWGHKESDTTKRLLCTRFTRFILYHWRRKWQPTPVFLPGESHGQRSLAGHGPWGRRELDMTEVTKHAHSIYTYYKKLAVFPVLYNIYL